MTITWKTITEKDVRRWFDSSVPADSRRLQFYKGKNSNHTVGMDENFPKLKVFNGSRKKLSVEYTHNSSYKVKRKEFITMGYSRSVQYEV